MPGIAAVKTKNSNRSYAPAYQQLNALTQQQMYANQTANAAAASLPVMVDDEKLANSIVNNEDGAPSVSELEACSLIYINGNFKWGVPEYGIQREPQCVAVVELRDANTNTVLASTTVAAGQSMNCNIDNFPYSSYNLSALSKIELPSDTAPTMEDVIAVMNQEQKQNAGLKIAAGAIIAGVAGNLLAPKDATAKTNDKIPIGTGKTQLIDTAIGAAAGAGIMAASTYSGKIAGDTIKSTAVNAASGMVVGNMLAGMNGGDAVIATTKCTMGEKDAKAEYDCVIGNVSKISTDAYPEEGFDFCIISQSRDIKCCKVDNNIPKCEAYHKELIDIKLAKEGTSGANDPDDFDKIFEKTAPDARGYLTRYMLKAGEQDEFETIPSSQASGDNTYYKIDSAKIAGETRRAYAVFAKGALNKPFGYKTSEWDDLNQTHKPKIYARNYDGSIGSEFSTDEYRFNASSRDADDGSLVDLSNKSRVKGTLVGTAAGGALGGLAGYQGAQTEVSERWVSSLREYEDSLSNFLCVTGNRVLSTYNALAVIPKPENKQQ